jgi:hypothetical protein
MELPEREMFEEYDFRIIDIPPKQILNILVSRFRHWNNFLEGEGSVLKTVLFCDCKDVVFQGDPFAWADTFVGGLDNFVLGFSEGWKHYQSKWNTNDQRQFAKGLGSDGESTTYPFGRWDILNGGVILGTPPTLADLCVMVEQTTLTSYQCGARCTDQAALNYAFRQADRPLRGEMILISAKDEGFVAHGEPIKQGLFEAEHHLEHATLIHTAKNEPFVLFHQWERTDYKDAILKRYLPLP